MKTTQHSHSFVHTHKRDKVAHPGLGFVDTSFSPWNLHTLLMQKGPFPLIHIIFSYRKGLRSTPLPSQFQHRGHSHWENLGLVIPPLVDPDFVSRPSTQCRGFLDARTAKSKASPCGPVWSIELRSTDLQERYEKSGQVT